MERDLPRAPGWMFVAYAEHGTFGGGRTAPRRMVRSARLALQTFRAADAISFQCSVPRLPADVKAPTEALNIGIGRERQMHEFAAGLENRIRPPRHVAPLVWFKAFCDLVVFFA
jgi:hypothetical protein